MMTDIYTKGAALTEYKLILNMENKNNFFHANLKGNTANIQIDVISM